MKKLLYTLIVTLIPMALFAGNPDRQGEPGAGELLINPWARSAGLHTMSTSCVSGVDAMHINIAGMSRINKTQVLIGNTNYLSGTEIRLNSIYWSCSKNWRERNFGNNTDGNGFW